MWGQRTVRAGLGALALTVGLVSAGCFAPGPPASPASLSVSPSPAIFQDSHATPPAPFPMPIVTVTVTNTGGHTAQSVVVHPVNIYSVPTTHCTSLAPGQSCTADVQFCPGSAGPYNFALQITGQDAVTGAPLQASTMLMGNAVTP